MERVGIPYETEEGVADFHAAGRHSYITGLVKGGASIVEAKVLARHSDVRTTMKYTHIDMNTQARALSLLPAPKDAGSDFVSNQVDVDSPMATHVDTHDDATIIDNNKTPHENGVYDASGGVLEYGSSSAKVEVAGRIWPMATDTRFDWRLAV